MLCEKCKQREATVHRQAIVNGVSHSEHLCSECAAKEGKGWMNDFDPFFNNDFFSDHGLSNWFQPFFQSMGATAPTKQLNQVGACPHCGMTWEDFQKNGLLGCSECYNHFADVLPPLLRRLHGQSEHIGKKPYNSAPAVKPQTPPPAPQAENLKNCNSKCVKPLTAKTSKKPHACVMKSKPSRQRRNKR